MRLTKAQTWALAHRLGGDALVELIVEDSWTCYRGGEAERRPWGYGCGACPACELRARGWEEWRLDTLLVDAMCRLPPDL
jgi:7-cyano-7-deazaguanine synthase